MNDILANKLVAIAGRCSIERDRETIIEATTALRAYAPAASQPDVLAGLDERLDRLFVSDDVGERFVLSTKSAKNIVGIVREWIRVKSAAPPPQTAASTAEPVADIIERCAQVAVAMTQKWGDPNGNDYQQGAQDHGIRIIHQIRALKTAAPTTSPEPDAVREALTKAVAYFEAKSHAIGEAEGLLWELQEALKTPALSAPVAGADVLARKERGAHE